MSHLSTNQSGALETSRTFEVQSSSSMEVGRNHNGVIGLPRTVKMHDAIWVIVDRLTKSAHFLSIQMTYTMDQLIEIYIKEIVQLHGVPISIISNRDARFTSTFWEKLHSAMERKLKFSTTFHPQTEGQSERSIQTLKDMLQGCAIDFQGLCSKYLPLVEFAWYGTI